MLPPSHARLHAPFCQVRVAFLRWSVMSKFGKKADMVKRSKAKLEVYQSTDLPTAEQAISTLFSNQK